MARGQSPYQGRYNVPMVDFSPLERGGAAWGSAFQNIGGAIAGGIKERRSLKNRHKQHQSTATALIDTLPDLLGESDLSDNIIKSLKDYKQNLKDNPDMSLRQRVAAGDAVMPAANMLMNLAFKKQSLDAQYGKSDGFSALMKALGGESPETIPETQTLPPVPSPETQTPTSAQPPEIPTLPPVPSLEEEQAPGAAAGSMLGLLTEEVGTGAPINWGLDLNRYIREPAPPESIPSPDEPSPSLIESLRGGKSTRKEIIEQGIPELMGDPRFGLGREVREVEPFYGKEFGGKGDLPARLEKPMPEPEPVEKGPKGAKGDKGPSSVKKPKSGDPYISKAGKKYPNLVYGEYNSDTDSWTVRPAEGYTFEVPLVEGKRRTNWNIIPIPKASPTMKAVKDALKPMQTPLPDAPVIPENVRKAMAGDEETMADLFESAKPVESSEENLNNLFKFGKIADLNEMGSEDASALRHLYQSAIATDNEIEELQLYEEFKRVANDVIERGDANNMDEIIKAFQLEEEQKEKLNIERIKEDIPDAERIVPMPPPQGQRGDVGQKGRVAQDGQGAIGVSPNLNPRDFIKSESELISSDTKNLMNDIYANAPDHVRFHPKMGRALQILQQNPELMVYPEVRSFATLLLTMSKRPQEYMHEQLALIKSAEGLIPKGNEFTTLKEAGDFVSKLHKEYPASNINFTIVGVAGGKFAVTANISEGAVYKSVYTTTEKGKPVPTGEYELNGKIYVKVPVLNKDGTPAGKDKFVQKNQIRPDEQLKILTAAIEGVGQQKVVNEVNSNAVISVSDYYYLVHTNPKAVKNNEGNYVIRYGAYKAGSLEADTITIPEIKGNAAKKLLQNYHEWQLGRQRLAGLVVEKAGEANVPPIETSTDPDPTGGFVPLPPEK